MKTTVKTAEFDILAANYDEMFQGFIKLLPQLFADEPSGDPTRPSTGKVEIEHWKSQIKEHISWAKQHLKKQDRIVWYLRWIRLLLVKDLCSSAPNPTLQKQWKANLLQPEINRMSGIVGADVSQLPLMRPGTSGLWETKLQEKLDHFFSLPAAGIQNTVLDSQTPDSLFNTFQEYENEWKEEAQKYLTPHPDDELVLQFQDGWAWWKLGRSYCSEEAAAMGHCGNIAGQYNRSERILSLRRPVQRGTETRWEPFLTFILDADGWIGEMKGRGNVKPAARYHPYITALLERTDLVKGVKGGGYLPSHNFSLNDLDDKTQDSLRKVNPNLVSCVTRLRELGGKPDRDLIKRISKSGVTEGYYDEKLNGWVEDTWDDVGKYVEGRISGDAFEAYEIFTGKDPQYESGYGSNENIKKVIDAVPISDLALIEDWLAKQGVELQQFMSHQKKRYTRRENLRQNLNLATAAANAPASVIEAARVKLWDAWKAGITPGMRADLGDQLQEALLESYGTKGRALHFDENDFWGGTVKEYRSADHAAQLADGGGDEDDDYDEYAENEEEDTSLDFHYFDPYQAAYNANIDKLKKKVKRMKPADRKKVEKLNDEFHKGNKRPLIEWARSVIPQAFAGVEDRVWDTNAVHSVIKADFSQYSLPFPEEKRPKSTVRRSSLLRNANDETKTAATTHVTLWDLVNIAGGPLRIKNQCKTPEEALALLNDTHAKYLRNLRTKFVGMHVVPEDPSKIVAWVEQQYRETKTAAPLHDEAKQKTYYHGTNSEESAQGIIRNGIQPSEILIPDKAKSRAMQAPMPDRVYLTDSFDYAAIYAMGGQSFGMGLTDQTKTNYTADQWLANHIKTGKYGYIFEVRGVDLTGDVMPDEDSIGEALAWVLDYRKSTQRLRELETQPERWKGEKEGLQKSMKIIMDQPITQAPENIQNRLAWLQTYLTPRQLDRVDEAAVQAQIGKKLQRRLPPEVAKWLLDHGAHLAHRGPVFPSRYWRFSKKDALYTKDLQSILREVPIQKTAAQKWYHGTSKQNAENILAEGVIRPGEESVYREDVPRYDAVYVTSEYQIAKSYAEVRVKGGTVFQVAVNEQNLLPDEDSILDALHSGFVALGARKNTKLGQAIREAWFEHWKSIGGKGDTFEEAWKAWGEIEAEGSSGIAEEMKELAEEIHDNNPALSRQIIEASAKAAHIGPVKVIGKPITAAAQPVQPVYFYIEVPRFARGHFWVEPPPGNLEFWAFRDRPRCFYNQKIIFTFDRKPVAEATVLKIEEPGQSECEQTGKFKKHWKVFWNPEQFKKYKTASGDKDYAKWHELADAQRGEPESAMLRIQHSPLAPGVFSFAVEHIGDLTHRMSEPTAAGAGRDFGYEFVLPKVRRCLSSLNHPYGFEREMEGNLKNNYGFHESKGDIGGKTFDQMKDELKALSKRYADAHRVLPAFNSVQHTARDAAVALGMWDFDAVRENLEALKTILDKGQDAWVAAASKSPQGKTAGTYRLYHGTVGDFDQFEGGHSNYFTKKREGFYFTDDLEMAKEFGRVLVADVTINHPLDLREEWKNPDFDKAFALLSPEYQEKIKGGPYNSIVSNATSRGLAQTPEFLTAAKEAGFDGIIMPDRLGHARWFDSYIAFDSSQIAIRSKAAAEVAEQKPELWEMKRDEYAPRPSYVQDPKGDWYTEETDEEAQVRYRKQRDWEQDSLAAMSLGKMTPEQAKERGYWIDVDKPDSFKPLPQTLYHVTTHKNEVLRGGLKTRHELAMWQGRGLGGGTDKAISFTEDLDIAKGIYDALILAVRVLTGKLGVQDLMKMAEEGVGAPKPWITNAIRWGGAHFVGNEWNPGEPYPPLFQDFLDGKKRVHDLAVSEADLPEGAEPVGEGWMGGDGKRRYTSYRMPMNEEEKQKVTWDWFKTWLAAREDAGGPLNPLFFSTDIGALAQMPESEIAILQFKPIPGALGTQESALGEWRVYSGKAVQLVGTVDSGTSKVSAVIQHPEEQVPVEKLAYPPVPVGAKTGVPLTLHAYRATTEPEFRANEVRGTFFSPEATPEFGEYIYRARLEFKNPLVVNDGTDAAKVLGDRKLAQGYEAVLSGWDSEKDAPLEAYNDAYEKTDKQLAALARKAGYDGIVFREHDDLNPVQYIVLDPKAIAHVENVGRYDWRTMKVGEKKSTVKPKAVSMPQEINDDGWVTPDGKWIDVGGSITHADVAAQLGFRGKDPVREAINAGHVRVVVWSEKGTAFLLFQSGADALHRAGEIIRRFPVGIETVGMEYGQGKFLEMPFEVAEEKFPSGSLMSVTAAARSIWYHGSSIKNLRSILAQGLIPDPKERAWADDPESSVYTPSRESYGGIYVTQNLLTATGAPRDGVKEGRVVLVVMELQPNTFYLDEDQVTGWLNAPIGVASDSDWNIGIYYLSATQPDVSGELKQSVEQAKQKYTDKFIHSMKYKYGERKQEMHPQLEARLRELLPDVWTAATTRLAAQMFRGKRRESANYDYARIWGNVFGSPSYNKGAWIETKETVRPKIPLEQAIPTVAEGEKAFREHAGQITRTLRQLAVPSTETSTVFNNARITKPIGYSGSNRIIAVTEIRNGRKYRGDSWKNPTVIIVHYGVLPEVFFKDYRQQHGENFVVQNAREEKAASGRIAGEHILGGMPNPLTIVDTRPDIIEDWVYLPEQDRKEMLSEAKEITVDPNDLKTDQLTVGKDEVEELVKNIDHINEPTKSTDEEHLAHPLVLGTNQGMFVFDGNHRCSAAKLAGVPIKVLYIDLHPMEDLMGKTGARKSLLDSLNELRPAFVRAAQEAYEAGPEHEWQGVCYHVASAILEEALSRNPRWGGEVVHGEDHSYAVIADRKDCFKVDIPFEKYEKLVPREEKPGNKAYDYDMPWSFEGLPDVEFKPEMIRIEPTERPWKKTGASKKASLDTNGWITPEGAWVPLVENENHSAAIMELMNRDDVVERDGIEAGYIRVHYADYIPNRPIEAVFAAGRRTPQATQRIRKAIHDLPSQTKKVAISFEEPDDYQEYTFEEALEDFPLRSAKVAAYTAYVLTDASRDLLLGKFPPKFSDAIAHHVTFNPGVKKDAQPPEPAKIEAVGYAADDSLEAVVVSVNGETKRPDGSTYHITLSLDRSKGRKPVHSNEVVAKGWEPVPAFELQTMPQKLAKNLRALREAEAMFPVGARVHPRDKEGIEGTVKGKPYVAKYGYNPIMLVEWDKPKFADIVFCQDVLLAEEQKKLKFGSSLLKKADRYNPEGFWAGEGNAASGILPVCPATGRIGLAMRSGAVDYPSTYSTIGGAVKRGMSPEQSAKEELAEETGYTGPIKLIPGYVFSSKGGFRYRNFLGVVTKEFGLHPQEGESANLAFEDENVGIDWVPFQEVLDDIKANRSKYHPEFVKFLTNSEQTIRRALGKERHGVSKKEASGEKFMPGRIAAIIANVRDTN